MEIKKNPKSNLENFSKIFVQLGLILALFSVYVIIEHKVYDRIVEDLGPASLSADDEEEMIITQRLDPIKPPPPPPPPAPEVLEIVEDEKEVEETVLETTETDEEEEVIVEEVVEVEEAEEVIEDVPFAIIEDKPIFPGCKGTKRQLEKCFSEKVGKHVNRRFDTGLASDLGLSPGRKRIFVSFKVDKTGAISEVMARAPHPRLKKKLKEWLKRYPK